ncbi:MAG: transcription termination/antitermination NusG family protein [Xanthomonadales bacterium]|jgi:transcriptional antiterminator RfaH|nr:transcription termination/antitermination NusG family protein [Xanthomonadales bacterium]
MPPREDTAHWFAVFCKPRQERRAREHLLNQGFDCYLPLAHNPFQRHRTRLKPGQGRREKAAVGQEPLFPRYLFLGAVPGRQSLAAVRSTRGAIDLVRTGPAPVVVPDAIIDGLRQREDPETGLISLQPDALEAGDRVRVFDGPFAGAEGVLQARSGEARSLVLLEVLGRQATLEVDSLLLQRAG